MLDSQNLYNFHSRQPSCSQICMMKSDPQFRIVSAKCTKCNSRNLRRSSWQRADGRQLRLWWSPYRCLACGTRFFRVSRRVVSYLGVASVCALIVSVITFIFAFYVVTDDTPKIAQPVSPPSTALPTNAETGERGAVDVSEGK